MTNINITCDCTTIVVPIRELDRLSFDGRLTIIGNNNQILGNDDAYFLTFDRTPIRIHESSENILEWIFGIAAGFIIGISVGYSLRKT